MNKKVKKILLLLICLFFITSCKEKVINIEIQKYCENGVPESGRCKVTESIDADVVCPDEFPLNRTSKFCERVLSTDAVKSYACSEGYKHIGGKCISEESFPKDENGKCADNLQLYYGECKDIKYHFFVYNCPDGILNNETNKCDFADQRTPEMSCPDGYMENRRELTCEKYHYEDAKEREVVLDN